jgi:hypothetical protein
MKINQIIEGSVPVKSLPTKFKNGDQFMDFVYDKWPSRDTSVENQGGNDWMAEIGGDDKIKAAVFDGETGMVSWLDEDHEEIE